MEPTPNRIQFYIKNSKVGFLLRILTIDDVSFWGANSLISVILALFIVDNIAGATAINVGIGLMLRELTLAFLSIPVGKMFDRTKGLLDEVVFLSISGFLVGTSYILMSFSTQIWQLYALMILIGIGHAVNLNAWRILFYGSIHESERGQTIGVYQTVMSITIALILGIGGFIGERYGFNVVLILGGMMSVVGGVLPLFLREAIKK